MTENKHQTFKSSCATQKFSIVSKIYHIWSLDRQCHGKHATKLSLMAIIYGHWIVSIVEACDNVLLNGHCYYGHLIVSSMEIMLFDFCHISTGLKIIA